MRFFLFGVLIAGALLAQSIPLPTGETQGGLDGAWKMQTFRNTPPTHYSVIEEDGRSVIMAQSQKSASGLVYEIDFDLAQYPILSWRWKIEGVLEDGDAYTKAGDDYAARVYVIFPRWIPLQTTSINYIWANRLPEGLVVPNPYFQNARMVAVQSGNDRAGEWRVECRNLYLDYREIFGKAPPKAGAIALMTDSDNTASEAIGYYAEITLHRADRDADPSLFCPPKGTP